MFGRTDCDRLLLISFTEINFLKSLHALSIFGEASSSLVPAFIFIFLTAFFLLIHSCRVSDYLLNIDLGLFLKQLLDFLT
jgi:hypothetical protein